MSKLVRRIAWTSLLHAAPVDEHPGVNGTGEHLREHLIGWLHPDQMPLVRPILDDAGHEQPFSLKGALNGPCILKPRKALEEGAQGPLHLFIGIEHDGAIRLSSKTAQSSRTRCQSLLRRESRETSVTRTNPTSPSPIAETRR